MPEGMPPPVPVGTSPGRPAHVPAIDVLRVLTVVGVIAVHATSLLLPTDDATGAVLSVLHATREIFLTLSAAVLAHGAAGRAPERRRFWRRRYPPVAIPYLVWSAIYLLADGHGGTPAQLAGRYLWDVLTAGARFHLYFLLLTFQLYLVFPWAYRQVRRRPDRHLAVVVAGLAFQLAFTSAIHFDLPAPFPVSAWLSHPGSWLPSYAGYVAIGIVVGLHLEEVLGWIRGHGRLVAGVALVAPALTLIGYGVDLGVLGMTPLRAGEVFQPAVVLDSAAFFALFLAVGLRVTDRGRPGIRRLATVASGSSFGVYLAHPLLIQGAVAAAGATGVTAILQRIPSGGALVLVVAGFAPALFVVTTTLVTLVRRTPLALPLTGRRRVRVRVPALFRVRRPAAVVAAAVVAVTAAMAAQLVGSLTGPRPLPAAHRAVLRSARTGAAVGPARTAAVGPARTGAPLHWVTIDVALTYDGLSRSYLVTAPPVTAGTHLPVLMVLHGRSVTPQFEEARTDFTAVTGPAILVYPAGYGESWDAGLCCSVASADHVDDVGFLTTVVRDVLRSRPDAEARRLYLAGYSNGGRMALTLACAAPQLFAGVAVYAATASQACAVLRPSSFLMVASTADPELTLGPGGSPQMLAGFAQPTVVGQVARFRAADRCPVASTVTDTPTLTTTGWHCAHGRRVGLVLYQGGSHAWPSGSTSTPSAEAVMWSWFTGLGA